MDDELFESVVRRVLAAPEVTDALTELSAGHPQQLAAFQDGLEQHLYTARNNDDTDFDTLTESVQYSMAESALDSALARQEHQSAAGENPAVRRAREQLAKDREIWAHAAYEKTFLPAAREWINDMLVQERRHQYRLEFDTPDTSGLQQMSAAQHEVPTTAFHRLRTLMRQLGGGSIGVSGPRGVGKSTLIQSACVNDAWFGEGRRSIGVFVPAPVHYDPREFLLHLFATLCLRIEPAAGSPAEPGRIRNGARIPPSFVMAVGAAILFGGLALIAVTMATVAPNRDGVAGLVLIAALLLASAIRTGRPLPSPPRDRSSDQQLPPYLVRAVLVTSAAGTVLSGFGAWRFSASGKELGLHAAAGVVMVLLTVTAAAQAGRRGLMPVALVGTAATFALLLANLWLTGNVPPALLVSSELLVITAVLPRFAMIISRWRGRWESRTHELLTRQLFEGAAKVGFIAFAAAVGFLIAATWKLAVDPRIAWAALLVMAGWRITTTVRVLSMELDAVQDELGSRPVSLTRMMLRDIRFQQTISHGWSEAWKLGAIASSPVSVERTATGGESLARVPMTYPEVVAKFHEYAAGLTKDGDSLVIGIDELDKMAPEDAHRFMNEIKAIFHGTAPRCYFLVSVSEEALAGFQQRGLFTRDVFDTAFDEMLKIDHMTVGGTISLLGRRVIDLPVGVAQLCHVLAGGLPRDVIRSMRVAVAVRGERESMPLAELAEALCDQELRNRLHGLRTELRSLPDWQDVADITDWARELVLTDPSTLKTDLKHYPQGEPPGQRLLRLHACSFYHLATVVQFFAKATPETLELAGSTDGIEQLAIARSEMSASWAQAWQRISEFRVAWDLLPVALPQVVAE